MRRRERYVVVMSETCKCFNTITGHYSSCPRSPFNTIVPAKQEAQWLDAPTGNYYWVWGTECGLTLSVTEGFCRTGSAKCRHKYRTIEMPTPPPAPPAPLPASREVTLTAKVWTKGYEIYANGSVISSDVQIPRSNAIAFLRSCVGIEPAVEGVSE